MVLVPLRAAPSLAGLYRRELRADQLRRARLMTEAWPVGRPTLVFAHPGFYHITGYRSADERTLGYRFLNACSAQELGQGFRHAAGAWVDPDSMYARGADQVLREAGSSLERELSGHGFEKRLVVEDRFELWTKTEPSARPESWDAVTQVTQPRP